MSKAFVLAMSPLEDNAANESEDEEDGKEADAGDKPGFLHNPAHTARWWSFGRKCKGGVGQLGLVE